MSLNEKSFLRRLVRTDFLLKGKFLIITLKKKTIFYAQRKDFWYLPQKPKFSKRKLFLIVTEKTTFQTKNFYICLKNYFLNKKIFHVRLKKLMAWHTHLNRPKLGVLFMTVLFFKAFYVIAPCYLVISLFMPS